jgi:hypothetical protein
MVLIGFNRTAPDQSYRCSLLKGIPMYRKFDPTSTASRLVHTLASTIPSGAVRLNPSVSIRTIDPLIKSTWHHSKSGSSASFFLSLNCSRPWSNFERHHGINGAAPRRCTSINLFAKQIHWWGDRRFTVLRSTLVRSHCWQLLRGTTMTAELWMTAYSSHGNVQILQSYPNLLVTALIFVHVLLFWCKSSGFGVSVLRVLYFHQLCPY